MHDFNYQRPTSISSVHAALASHPEAKLIAGGQTLIPTMKQRLAAPEWVVDLGGVAELAGIKVDGDDLVIGAMTRHATVAASADVKRLIPALAALADGIGDPQVRNRGTIGGSIANADPAADYPAAVLGLGATVITNARQIAADAFFTGMFETALKPGEVITAVRFPKPEKAAYMKFPNPASRYAVVGVFCAKTKGGVRVAVTGAAGSVFRVAAYEQALGAKWAPEAIANGVVKADGLNADIHATAAYRAHLVAVMARRAVAAA